MEVAPGTIAVWSDLQCPWAHVALWRLWDARRRLGLEDRVRFDHRAFPLELFNSEPTPYRSRAAEIPVCAALAPMAGWQAWQAPLSEWPVTTLLPMEAVRAAREQSLAASEQLDRALRVAFFGESRCISLRHVILEVANDCDGLDVAALADALDAGRARRRTLGDWLAAGREGVRGSPHLF
ncbi:MAG: DsbA family protein, partial [Chloroflexi bacterium]|nr:DsbA family protein [Chloroflexota bacterium]